MYYIKTPLSKEEETKLGFQGGVWIDFPSAYIEAAIAELQSMNKKTSLPALRNGLTQVQNLLSELEEVLTKKESEAEDGE